MQRVIAYIDGYNLYYGLRTNVTIAQSGPRCFLGSENRTLPIENQE